MSSTAAIFGVPRSIIAELKHVRREVRRLQCIEELASVAADRSVQFKAASPDRLPR